MTTMSTERTCVFPVRQPPGAPGRPGVPRSPRAAGHRPGAGRPVVLVVSELVTDALRHGGGVYALRLAAHPVANA